MPPKVKITKEEIVEAALEMVRGDGKLTLNARSLASALGCSTQPIFSNFETMEALRESVIARAYETYLSFIEKELALKKYPPYKTFGMAYIRFAEAEKELFRLLFMRDRTGEDLSPSSDFEVSVSMIAEANAISRELASLVHMEMWACVHGIAVMHATSFLSLEESLISRMLSDVYQGVCTRLCEENKKNVCN